MSETRGISSKSSKTEIIEYLKSIANIIPLKNDKSPNISSWSKYFVNKLPMNPNVINSDAYGVVCGGESWLFVVDFDTNDGFFKFIADNPNLKNYFDKTLIVKTNRGYHAYFKSTKLPKNSHNSIYGGIDIKSSKGYVVGPGSVISKFNYDADAEPNQYKIVNNTPVEILDLDEESDNACEKISEALKINEKYNICTSNNIYDFYETDVPNNFTLYIDGSYKLDNTKYQNMFKKIGLKNIVLQEYLSFKKYNYYQGKRSDYDFNIVMVLILGGFTAEEVYAFFYKVNNPLVKACEQLAKNNKSYLNSIIVKVQNYAEELPKIHNKNRKILENLKTSIMSVDPKVLLPKESESNQIKLHGVLIILIDFCIELGFFNNVRVSGTRFAELNNCSTTTAYKWLRILDKNKLFICTEKGSNYNKKSSKYKLNKDRIIDIINTEH